MAEKDGESKPREAAGSQDKSVSSSAAIDPVHMRLMDMKVCVYGEVSVATKEGRNNVERGRKERK